MSSRHDAASLDDGARDNDDRSQSRAHATLDPTLISAAAGNRATAALLGRAVRTTRSVAPMIQTRASTRPGPPAVVEGELGASLGEGGSPTRTGDPHSTARTLPVHRARVGAHDDPAEREADHIGADVARGQWAPASTGHADAAVERFTARHRPAELGGWRAQLGERPATVQQTTPLGTIRRMGRDRGSSGSSPRREDLERVALTDNDTYVRDVLAFFYPGLSHDGPANDDMQRLAAALLWAATEQSRAIDWVPRPSGGRPSPTWLVKQAVQAAFRWSKDEGIYEAVRLNVARNYRTSYEELRNGLPITALP